MKDMIKQWLKYIAIAFVGMNATRYYSILHEEYGRTLNVGRVLSPTMAMIVDREKEIEMFVPETYFSVKLNVGGTIFESRHLKTEEEAIRVEQRFRETTLG